MGPGQKRAGCGFAHSGQALRVLGECVFFFLFSGRFASAVDARNLRVRLFAP